MNSIDGLSRGEKIRITELRKRLIAWFAVHGRNFPWRQQGVSVFEKICVEVLLQRTRAETVSIAYSGFFNHFNSWVKIATAATEELEEAFRPLGLWQRRARSIKDLAIYAVENNGKFPNKYEELLKISGIGQYIANAILLFQHGKPKPFLDVNMARVLERYIRPRKLADIRYDPWLQEAGHWLVRGGNSLEANWAVLDFASLICKPRKPLCDSCNLSSSCKKP